MGLVLMDTSYEGSVLRRGLVVRACLTHSPIIWAGHDIHFEDCVSGGANSDHIEEGCSHQHARNSVVDIKATYALFATARYMCRILTAQ